MLRSVIRFALRQRLLTLGLAVVVVLFGVRSFFLLPVEAFPDVQDVQVQVIASWTGHAAEELEKYVTLPIERTLNGTPHLTNLRSASIFGLSVVTLTFEDGTQDFFARQQVLERLQAASVPAGVQPQLAPLSNSLGEIYRYVVKGDLPLEELKALQDWVVEPAFRTVPGVTDVVSFGGAVKQYQVDVDPARLAGVGVTLPQVELAIANANGNAGGGYITHGWERHVVRGVGLVASTDDIGNVAVVTRNGATVRVRDIGRVTIGWAPREGIVAKDSADDVVQGIVLLRKGEHALPVLEGVRAKAAALNAHGLPPGVSLVSYYDRAQLVNHTVDTVRENLAVGATLVIVILLAFLGDWRAALVVGSVIPLSLLAAFILMDVNQVAANLISLGAVDFGLIVDAAVVMAEAYVVRFALESGHDLGHPVSETSPPEGLAPPTPTPAIRVQEWIAQVTETMGRPMLFSVTCVVTAFVPIFTFQRVERRIFSPMAYTLTFTLLASMLCALTVIPVLASFLMKPDGVHRETALTRFIHRLYLPARDWAFVHWRVVLGTAFGALLIALAVGARLGTEFLPQLDEGNIWLTVTLPVGVAPGAAKDIERAIRGTVRGYPQVSQVVSQLGRPDDGTDAKGFNNIEIYANLHPEAEWRGITDKDSLLLDMTAKLRQIPGIQLNFSQYIKDNVEEALSGVKGELVVKVFGADLAVLQRTAGRIRDVMATIPGVADLGLEQQFGQPQIRLVADRAALARHGLAVSDLNDAIETAVGGRAVSTFLEGERQFEIRVRYVAAQRDNPAAIAALAVATPDGRTVPLGTVARVVTDEGASRISREGNERRIAVKCSVRGRDQGGFVAEAQAAVAREVPLPPGYRVTWGGQFENQRRATARLALIVPVSIGLIFLLLFSAFGSTRYAALILTNLPFALIGGVLTLWARGIHLSVSAAVGFVALFGIAVQNGILLVSEFNRRRDEGMGLDEALRTGTEARLRPVVMTALMAAIGLLPAALSTRIGAETTRPFASVIVGGLATSTVLTLLVLPILYRLYHEKPHAELAR